MKEPKRLQLLLFRVFPFRQGQAVVFFWFRKQDQDKGLNTPHPMPCPASGLAVHQLRRDFIPFLVVEIILLFKRMQHFWNAKRLLKNCGRMAKLGSAD